MPLYEHWVGEATESLLPSDTKPEAKAYITEDETLCCTFEAKDWAEAKRLYQEHRSREDKS